MDAPQPDATACVQRLADGDERAADALMPLVYDELRAIAGRHFRRERAGHTLEPTALVNEAYAELVDATGVDWAGRTHFLAVAATAMRRILIQHARKRGTLKRGGDRQRVTLDGRAMADAQNEVDLIDLDRALQRLSETHERPARVVELRFFGGLEVKEVAAVLGVSERTVKEDWRFARALLRREMVDDAG